MAKDIKLKERERVVTEIQIELPVAKSASKMKWMFISPRKLCTQALKIQLSGCRT